MASALPPRLRLRADNVAWRGVEGEIIALDPDTSTYLAINGTGSILWQALLEGATRDRLVGLLADTYAIDRDRAATDVDTFLAQLDDRQWLEGFEPESE